jgi:hypothetical protein
MRTERCFGIHAFRHGTGNFVPVADYLSHHLISSRWDSSHTARVTGLLRLYMGPDRRMLCMRILDFGCKTTWRNSEQTFITGTSIASIEWYKL